MLQKQSIILKAEIEKINQKYQQEVNEYNSQPELARDMADAMFGGKIKSFYKSLSPLSVSSLES